MPIYEYLCPKCGQFEITQRITEDALKRCPTCRSGVKKLISQTSFQLKGTGWYVTDYARKPGSSGTDTTTGKESASGKDSTASKGTGTDSGDASSTAPTEAAATTKSEKSESSNTPSKESKKESKKASSAKAA